MVMLSTERGNGKEKSCSMERMRRAGAFLFGRAVESNRREGSQKLRSQPSAPKRADILPPSGFIL